MSRMRPWLDEPDRQTGEVMKYLMVAGIIGVAISVACLLIVLIKTI